MMFIAVLLLNYTADFTEASNADDAEVTTIQSYCHIT